MTSAFAAAEHVVQFYDRDEALCGSIAEFAAAGLTRGERVLLIVSAGRRGPVEALLAETSADAPPSAGRLLWMDADALLVEVTAAGAAGIDHFRSAIERALAGSSAPYRVFGELVALLAARGMLDMAIEIEALGQALAAGGVAVLCAYDLRQLKGDGARSRVASVHDCAMDVSTSSAGPVVLLADDFDDARELYREYLQTQGFNVVTAVDGVDALERAREMQPAVVLLDVQMPRMSGLDAMKALKADAVFAGVPIAALTAHARGEQRDMFLAEGFDEVIAKPCLPDDLARTLRTLIARSASRDAIA